MGFGGKVYEQNWTYLGKRLVLATTNVRDNPEAGGPHLWAPNHARWELRECHVLLVDPKEGPGFLFSFGLFLSFYGERQLFLSDRSACLLHRKFVPEKSSTNNGYPFCR